MEIEQIMEAARDQLGVLWQPTAPDADASLEEWAEWVLEDEVWFDEASAPKEPIARALKRMADAFDRGGFKKMIRATEIRLNAVKKPEKREGMLAAIALHIKDNKYSSSEKKALLDLLRKTTHAHAAATEGAEQSSDLDERYAHDRPTRRVPSGEFDRPTVRVPTDRPTKLVPKLATAKKKTSRPPAAPKHYVKVCDMESFRKNIEYFFKIKGKDWPGDQAARMKRAIAASYTVLKRSCGVKNDKHMKPSEILKNATRKGVPQRAR